MTEGAGVYLHWTDMWYPYINTTMYLVSIQQVTSQWITIMTSQWITIMTSQWITIMTSQSIFLCLNRCSSHIPDENLTNSKQSCRKGHCCWHFCLDQFSLYLYQFMDFRLQFFLMVSLFWGEKHGLFAKYLKTMAWTLDRHELYRDKLLSL